MKKRFLSLRPGFTLIELLVVIAIMAILAVVVVLVLNPAEMLKQGRDSTRLSDLNTLTTALGIFTTDQPSASLGTASTTYVSIADSDSTCANLGLPAAPTGWSYHCVPSSSLRKVDGTGWIPVSFASIASGAPVSQLPVDPTNTTSTGLYYTYTPGGSYELTALFESQKHSSRAGGDGGPDPTLYETGTDLELSPFVSGMVGYWEFEEGGGSSVIDSSGQGNHGTWVGGGTHYGTAKFGSYAGAFNGSAYVQVPSDSSLNFGSGPASLFAWVNITAHTTNERFWKFDNTWQLLYWSNPNAFCANEFNSNILCSNFTPATGQWYHVGFVADPAASSLTFYVNGQAAGSSVLSSAASNNGKDLFIGGDGNPASVSGLMDDVRFYKRALTAQQVLAIYNHVP